ncbi:TPA: hypothetical protein ACKQBZ_000085 [Stenotrophomonas maltophilia]|uniref:hypothetical protein n=1 Tax=Stenotrophomonas sp. Sm6012 TaxID=3002745 RepID=UPI0027E40606|nr:hypothetical protein [Stenotrophomonas sp. Sm6012]MDQ7279399.1 hypothetical protein [Stenotrophomonas sp. Sm6012]HEL3178327.1 hypothetical protein [Stenotrophomonas maltophilia]
MKKVSLRYRWRLQKSLNVLILLCHPDEQAKGAWCRFRRDSLRKCGKKFDESQLPHEIASE